MSWKQIKPITDSEVTNNGLVSAPTVMNGTPAENKARFDKLVRDIVVPRVNLMLENNQKVGLEESARVTAEAERVSAEEARKTAEEAREAAEAQRRAVSQEILTAAEQAVRNAGASADYVSEAEERVADLKDETVDAAKEVRELEGSTRTNAASAAEDAKTAAEAVQAAEAANAEIEENTAAAQTAAQEAQESAQQAQAAMAAVARGIIYCTSGMPAAELGGAGDWAIDPDTGDLYHRVTWKAKPIDSTKWSTFIQRLNEYAMIGDFSAFTDGTITLSLINDDLLLRKPDGSKFADWSEVYDGSMNEILPGALYAFTASGDKYAEFWDQNDGVTMLKEPSWYEIMYAIIHTEEIVLTCVFPSLEDCKKACEEECDWRYASQEPPDSPEPPKTEKEIDESRVAWSDFINAAWDYAQNWDDTAINGLFSTYDQTLLSTDYLLRKADGSEFASVSELYDDSWGDTLYNVTTLFFMVDRYGDFSSDGFTFDIAIPTWYEFQYVILHYDEIVASGNALPDLDTIKAECEEKWDWKFYRSKWILRGNLKGAKGDPGKDGKDGMAGRTARFVVGTSTAGWTADDCDYLCDGLDDQVEINAAISALPRTGGKVVVLAGNYRLTGDMVVKSNVTIEGEGSGTYIAFISGADGNIVPAGAETAKVSNVALQGLYIRSYESESEGLVFCIKRITGLTIRSCNMHGMVLQNCNKGSVSGCTISGDANTDALAIKDSGGLAVTGCQIDGNLELSGSTVHCAITGNVVDPSGGRLCTIAGTASRNAVVGNVSTSGDAAITGTGTDNVCANNVYPGISES